MPLVLVLPLIAPLSTAVVGLLAYRSRAVQRAASFVGAAGLFAASVALLSDVLRHGTRVAQIDNWPAPFGISLVADLFAAIMVVLTGTMGLAVVVYSLTSIDPRRERYGYHPLLHFLLLGVSAAFLTGDLFNLYVWFEVMLMASFVLMALGGERPQMEGAIKYVTLNMLASAIFLAALGMTYGLVGTLNMADASGKIAQLETSRPAGVVSTLSGLYMAAFGIKAAVFPLFFWLPASYHTPPAPVSALFAGLLTKVGVYALIRIFTLLFAGTTWQTHALLQLVAGLTMVTGVLGAVAQSEMRRILSFHIISQIGYMVMGLALFTPLGLGGSIFYIIHHIIVKANLFLIAGIVRRVSGSYELASLGGLYRSHPALAMLFLVPALSLAGLPPLSGFFAKLALVQAGIAVRQYAIVAVALAVGLLTLFSMMKIWIEAFWKAPARARPASPLTAGERLSLLAATGGLAAITVFIGLGAQAVFGLSLQAAEQLLDSRAYVEAVLGGAP